MIVVEPPEGNADGFTGEPRSLEHAIAAAAKIRLNPQLSVLRVQPPENPVSLSTSWRTKNARSVPAQNDVTTVSGGPGRDRGARRQNCGGRRTRYKPVAVSIRPQSRADVVSDRTRGDGSVTRRLALSTTYGRSAVARRSRRETCRKPVPETNGAVEKLDGEMAAFAACRYACVVRGIVRRAAARGLSVRAVPTPCSAR